MLSASISLVMALLLLWPEPIQTTPVGKPLATWLSSLFSVDQHERDHALVNLEIWLNFLIFIPFTFLLHLVFGRLGWWWAPVIAVLASVSAELIQKVFLTQRVSSIQDVLLNTAGALVGWGMALLVSRWGKTRER